ncbi:MAG: hypothetical protein HDR53_03935 [Treponema sp.]|nr:hypothetical protein [Treponema sp.]
MAGECKVFFARNLQELFYQKKTISGLSIVGACTHISHLPEKSISSTLIPELTNIEKHERFIEFGPGVTLGRVLGIGEHHIPQVIYNALKTISNPFVRNCATIGGNICAGPQRLTLFSPLLALDAKLELKSPFETHYISLQNFTEIEKDFVLTKIRVPLSHWDIELYSRLGPASQITEDSGGFTFLMSFEKGVITNIRIAFAGSITFRCTALENRLLGLRLPINTKEIDIYLNEAESQFIYAEEGRTQNKLLRSQFKNLMRTSLEQLT